MFRELRRLLYSRLLPTLSSVLHQSPLLVACLRLLRSCCRLHLLVLLMVFSLRSFPSLPRVPPPAFFPQHLRSYSLLMVPSPRCSRAPKLRLHLRLRRLVSCLRLPKSCCLLVVCSRRFSRAPKLFLHLRSLPLVFCLTPLRSSDLPPLLALLALSCQHFLVPSPHLLQVSSLVSFLAAA